MGEGWKCDTANENLKIAFARLYPILGGCDRMKSSFVIFYYFNKDNTPLPPIIRRDSKAAKTWPSKPELSNLLQ